MDSEGIRSLNSVRVLATSSWCLDVFLLSYDIFTEIVLSTLKVVRQKEIFLFASNQTHQLQYWKSLNEVPHYRVTESEKV